MKALALFLVLISCSRHRSLSAEQQLKITSEIKTTLENYYNDIRKQGLTAEFKYLDSSDDFFWIPPGYKSSIPFDSVATILRNTAPLYITIDNRWLSLDILPHNNKNASYTGTIRSEMKDTSGNIKIIWLEETGKLIKKADGWKLLSGTTRMTADK